MLRATIGRPGFERSCAKPSRHLAPGAFSAKMLEMGREICPELALERAGRMNQ
jgi:hypothetical protein